LGSIALNFKLETPEELAEAAASYRRFLREQGDFVEDRHIIYMPFFQEVDYIVMVDIGQSKPQLLGEHDISLDKTSVSPFVTAAETQDFLGFIAHFKSTAGSCMECGQPLGRMTAENGSAEILCVVCRMSGKGDTG
jgi:hypothetical protein